MSTTKSEIKAILERTRCAAIVGLSANPARPSFGVAQFLQAQGWKIIPINPGQAGKIQFGEMVYATLREAAAVHPEIDMVDIFRRSDQVRPIVEDALEVLAGLKTIWMQLGVEDADAAALAEARGVDVVMNRCPKIEFARVF